jgi:hypothetical protein
LKITRKQIPLAPAFAMTAHASQGKTLKGGAIVDLCIGKGSNPLGSYVAMTRVKSRKDVLVYHPFPRELFTQGPRKGPDLLLKLLRGEMLNWKEIEEEHMPSRLCKGCNFVRYKDAFHAGQWGREDKISFCLTCCEAKKAAGTPMRCNNCGIWKIEAAIPEKYRYNWCLRTRVCETCVERRKCRGKCEKYLDESQFTKSEWDHAGWPHDHRGKCRDCRERGQETKPCAKCHERYPREAYIKPGASDDAWFSNDYERTCLKCRGSPKTKQCSKCKKYLPRAAYGSKGASDDQWFSNEADRKCSTCRKEQSSPGMWRCVECIEVKPQKLYSKWLSGKKNPKKKHLTRCNVCFAAQQAHSNSAHKESMSYVAQKNGK